MNVQEHTRWLARFRFMVVFLLLGGCATCQTHPVACAIGSAVVVGSIVATVNAHNDRGGVNPIRRGGPGYPSVCVTNPAICQ